MDALAHLYTSLQRLSHTTLRRLVELSLKLTVSYTSTTAPPPPSSHIKWVTCQKYSFLKDFHIRNESWTPIKHLEAYLLLASMGCRAPDASDEFTPDERCAASDASIHVSSAENEALRWIFIQSKFHVGSIYRADMEVSIQSVFTEFQFAINFQSIADRARFMIVNNRQLVFQSVKHGVFMPYLATKPLSLDINRVYRISIVVIYDCFYFYLENNLIMSLKCKHIKARASDRLAIILFEERKDRPIKATISKLQISEGHMTHVCI
jgi:hypothetical protein